MSDKQAAANGLIRRLMLVALVTLLSACSKIQPADEPIYENYLRLNRLLGSEPVDLVDTLNQPVPPLPAKRDMLISLTEYRFDISDLWRYGSCGLMQRMGERNSLLGKVMPTSQQLIYETQLIATLTLCIKQFGDAPEHQWLQQLKTQKQAALAELWHNLMWAEPELRKLLQPPGQRQLPRQGRQIAVSALQSLLALKLQTLNGEHALEQNFELILAKLRGVQYLGQLLMDARNSLIIINKTNELISRQLPKVSCIDKRPSTQAKQLKQYLQGYYARHSQPALAALLSELAEVMAILPPLFTDAPAGSTISALSANGYHHELIQSIRDYQSNWQRFFQRCGLSLQT